MLKRMSVVEFISKIKDKVETNTGLTCYDEMPSEVTVPCYYVEMTGRRSEGTKTMWSEVLTAWVHILPGESNGRAKANEMMDALEEALTEAIAVPEGVTLIMQSPLGPVDKQRYETQDQHVILAYEFKVSYGFQTK